MRWKKILNYMVLYSLIAIMSSRCLPHSDKGKRTTKPRRKSCYILKVPLVIPSTSTPTPPDVRLAYRTPTQESSPALVPMPSPSIVNLLWYLHHALLWYPHHTLLWFPHHLHQYYSLLIQDNPLVVALLHTPCISSSIFVPSPDISNTSYALNSIVDEVDSPFHDWQLIEPYGQG